MDGKFIQSVGEALKLWRGEYNGCGEEYKVEKRERGRNIIFLITFRLLGRISSGKMEKGTKISEKKINI